MLSHLIKLSEVQFPQRTRNAQFDLTRISINYVPALLQDSAVPNQNAFYERSGSSEQVASEQSEAAPERKLPRSE